ncbi:MAG: threonylcarbamoyl-AMP synthase [Chloroflexi bacterium RBG_16_50_9]|nr:MAG: threonylcarbamoyl-AMP synthase [Chloroflexi bacterium RBG_16_50_9]
MSIGIKKIDATSPDSRILRQAARLIARGEVLVCPTDTGYAFSANALDTGAVVRVFSLKGRSYSNPVHMAVSSMEEAEKYARINQAARQLAERYLPGALTLVLPRRETVPAILVAGRETIGIRIPNNRVILSLIKMAEVPLTTTSANISGQPTPYAVEEVMEQLGAAIEKVALVLDQGPLPSRGLSTIVDLTVSPPQLIRQGLISWLDIREILGSRRSSG